MSREPGVPNRKPQVGNRVVHEPDGRSIVVVGAAGQLGRVMATRFAETGRVHALDRRQLDITDTRALQSTIAALSPGVVINCAAFNDVDGAEQKHVQALAVNAFAVGALARAVERAGATFVHFSTDFVFAGRENRVWTETDTPEPLGVYAQSKLTGEWMARDATRHYVLRVESLFGGPHRRSTIDRIVAALSAGREMKLFHDRTVSPSFVDDVAEATLALVGAGGPWGLYHCVNSGATTWLEVGRTVARVLGCDDRLVVPVSVKDMPMRVERPQFAVLSNAKLAAAGAPLPSWDDALERYLRRLAESSD